MLFYQGIIAGVLAFLLLNTIMNLRWLNRSIRLSLPAETPFVSILIPARNEARAIADCVASLARQDYPHFEILVLDDHSEDQTATIVAALTQRYPMVRLLQGQPLPTGWHGKAFACAQLAQAARGEWLLFVDADTVHAPAALSTAMGAAQGQRADLLTMMPRIEVGSFGEALLLPVITMTFGSLLPLGLVTRTRWPLLSGALGPFLLFRRESYCRIGGHAAVRADIVEDMQLSRLVKRQGGRVVWIDGTSLTRIRFYHSAGEAWQGLAKSTFTAINYSLLSLAIGLLGVLALFVAPYAFLVDGLLSHHDTIALLWLPLAQVLCIVLAQLLLARRFHLSRGMVLLHVVTMLAVIACTLTAAYQVLLGKGVAWKGRTYQFRPQPTHAVHSADMATWLSMARWVVAGSILLLGWRAGSQSIRVVAVLTLMTWSSALLEQTLRKHADSWWATGADSIDLVAGLGYLTLASLLKPWPAAIAALALAISVCWYSWRVVAVIGLAASGSILLFIATTYWPVLHMIIFVWIAGMLVLERHTLAQNVGEWLHHLRSS